MPSPPQSQRVVDAAVVFANSAASVGLIERLARQQKFKADGFDASIGLVADCQVVVAVPTGGNDAAKVIDALVAGHRPPLLIAAGFSRGASGTAQAGKAAIVDRIVGDSGASIALTCPEPLRRRLKTVTVTHGTAGVRPVTAEEVMNTWAHPIASACADRQLAASIVTVLSEPASVEEGDRPSLARRAGRMLRQVWQEPRSILRAADRVSQRWQHQETLADAVEAVLAAAQ